jgi:hypothetical protein
MFRKCASALFFAFVCLGNASPSKAAVLYELTFTDSKGGFIGTGEMVLNVDSIAQASNIGLWSGFGSVLTQITTPSLGGYGPFTITPDNLSNNSNLQTGAQGQVYTLSAPQSGSGGMTDVFLVLWTQTWQLHTEHYNGPQILEGKFTISAPILGDAAAPPMETPLPAALPLFASALVGGGLMTWRRKRKQKAEALAA